MPNQANKSNDKSGIVKPKEKSTMPSTQKEGTKGNAINQSNGGKKGAAGGSSKGGSKTISSGSGNE